MAESTKEEIIERPENWDDIVDKYLEQEARQLQKVLVKRKASNPEELKKIAAEAIFKRSLRTEHTTLKEKEKQVVSDSSSHDIQQLKAELREDINMLAKQFFKALPETTLKGLKGRVSVRTEKSEEEENASSER